MIAPAPIADFQGAKYAILAVLKATSPCAMTDHLVELQHIYLEIQAERWQHIERFFLPYVCYREHYLTSHNKPDWQVARAHAPKSQRLIASGERGQLEPLVPYSSVIGLLKSKAREGALSLEDVQSLLDQFLHLVVICEAELSALKLAGLSANMPPNWYRSQNQKSSVRFEQIGSEFKDLSI